MGKRTKIILLSIFFFLFIICFFQEWKRSETVWIRFVQDAPSETAITAKIQTKDYSITVDAFPSDGGNYYLFLPSWAEGKFLAGEGFDTSLPASISESGIRIPIDQEHILTILAGSEIPSVFLTLEHDLSYISSDKTVSDAGQAFIFHADGTNVYTGALEKIKGRGNSSWEQEKKPFNITLENAAPISENNSRASEFVLIASSDISFLRNRISNEMARAMEAPYMEGGCINLYINGSFQGIYEMYQKITPDSLGIRNLESETKQLNRFQNSVSQSTTGMALDDWNHSVTGKWWNYEKNPDNITGGYLLEMDHAGRYADEASGFILASGAYVVSKSPSLLSEAQYQYISSYMQECENAMVSGAAENSVEELSQYIDIPSFIAKYLVEEVSKNIDCSSTSQYFYKNQNGVLYAGPAWDYDWAYGVERTQENIDYLDPEGFSAREVPGTLKWWQLLYYNDAIYHNIAGTYEETLYPYLNQLAQSEFSLWKEEIEKSAVMDYIRWNRCGTSGIEEARNYYDSQTSAVLDFLRQRKEYLRREWR